MLLEVECKERDNKGTFLGFLDRATSHLDKFKTLLQVNAFHSVIDNLIEVFDLSISVNWPLILILSIFIAIASFFIMNIVKDNVVAIGEVKDSH